jgi:His-Xaa-Ser system radical SAM maturase HxsB
MMGRRFLPVVAFDRAPESRHQLLPFRFTRLQSGTELLVSETGEYVLAPMGTAQAVVRGDLSPSSDLYRTLKSRHFVTDDRSSPLLDVIATKVRTKRAASTAATALHIFVVTLRCEHSCHYCQVSRQSEDRVQFDMSEEAAAAAIDLMLRSPAKRITMEFQGGEPLLAFDRVRWITERAERLALQAGKELEVVIVSNLALVDDEMLSWMRDHRIMVSTSIDGPAELHDANRPRTGGGSHERAVRGIDRVRAILGNDRVSALMTTTRRSLDFPDAIVDEYVRLDLRSVFARPLSPYGFATKTANRTGYTMAEFLPFYEAVLARTMCHAKAGVPIQETYATLALTKILTPFSTGYVDLQSPAGAGLSVLVYNYDGDVYATDESRMLAEMGDHRLRLGNVRTLRRQDLFATDAMALLLAGATHETAPGCETCAFQSYCGADPVFHYATQGDPVGVRPTSDFCRRHLHLFDHLFGLIENADDLTWLTFFSWVRGVSRTQALGAAS